MNKETWQECKDSMREWPDSSLSDDPDWGPPPSEDFIERTIEKIDEMGLHGFDGIFTAPGGGEIVLRFFKGPFNCSIQFSCDVEDEILIFFQNKLIHRQPLEMKESKNE